MYRDLDLKCLQWLMHLNSWFSSGGAGKLWNLWRWHLSGGSASLEVDLSVLEPDLTSCPLCLLTADPIPRCSYSHTFLPKVNCVFLSWNEITFSFLELLPVRCLITTTTKELVRATSMADSFWGCCYWLSAAISSLPSPGLPSSVPVSYVKDPTQAGFHSPDYSERHAFHYRHILQDWRPRVYDLGRKEKASARWPHCLVFKALLLYLRLPW